MLGSRQLPLVHGFALLPFAFLTMQLFTWQQKTLRVAHYILDCFDVLGALKMLLMMHQLQPHLRQPWRLEGVFNSLTYHSHTLSSPLNNTMQLFMWQRDIVGVTSRVASSSSALAPG